jgi:hypothetical protein
MRNANSTAAKKKGTNPVTDSSRDLAASDQGGRALAIHDGQSRSLIQMILEAARDPTVDAAKVETMANLAIKLQDRERETQFGQDFAAAVSEMPRISKRGRIIIPAKDGKPAREQGKFAHFEDIDRVVRPILDRHNLVITFRLGSDAGQTTATPILTHRNGYRDIGEALRVPPDTSGSKNAAQAVGSSSSYAKRYAMCAALNIVTEGEDTDGRSYPLPNDPLNDRQLRLVAEAEQSANDGNYDEWFKRQQPKDREWLVVTGVHARVGGAPALPGPRTAPAAQEPEEAQYEPAQDLDEATDPAPPAAAQERPRLTPEQWVAGYKREVAKIRDQDRLDEYVDGKRDALERMKAKSPELHQECTDAVKYQRDAISEGRLM